MNEQSQNGTPKTQTAKQISEERTRPPAYVLSPVFTSQRRPSRPNPCPACSGQNLNLCLKALPGPGPPGDPPTWGLSMQGRGCTPTPEDIQWD